MKLRFSIRDLLWLTLVAALCVGWWIDRCKLKAAEEKAVLQVLEKIDGITFLGFYGDTERYRELQQKQLLHNRKP